MKKEIENNVEAATAQIITSGTVKAALEAAGVTIEMVKGKEAKCSAEQYGALIFLTLNSLGLLPDSSVVPAMQAWNYIPKNPSAMRQLFEAAGKEATTPGVSALMAKFLPKTPEA